MKQPTQSFKLALVLLSSLCMLILAQPTRAARVPADNGEQDVAQGRDLLKHQQYQAAREAFEEGLGKNPRNAPVHFYLGEACRGMRDWTCAEEQYDMAIELDATSSRVVQAKSRLRMARAWRTLRDLESRLNDPNGSVDQIRQTQHQMDLAKASGLDEEQQVIYHQLKRRVDQKIAAQAATVALEKKVKAMAALRQLEGKWQFVENPTVFRATVNQNAELEMRILQVTPDMEAEGIRNGDKFLWTVPLTPEPDLRGYQQSRRDSFREGAILYLTGTRLVSYFLERAYGCDRKVGYIPIKTVLAYVASTDTIRLLPLGRVRRSSDCSVREEQVNDEHDFYSADWQEEMKRQ